MSRFLIVVVTLAACGNDSKPAAPADAPSAPTVPSAASASEQRTACLRGIGALASARTPVAEVTSTLALAGACAGYCSTADADRLKAATCKTVDGALSALCTTQDCAAICANKEQHPYFVAIACAQAARPSVAEAPTLQRNDRVMAQWTDNRWYPGRITNVWSDGTIDVAYDDGDRSRGLPASKVRFVKRPVASTSAQSTSQRVGLREGASCAGPGWQYVCGGRCTDTKIDNNNCGGCGRRCDDGYRCDGSGTCRTASGGL
jgi:hypothetical protein